MSASGVRLQKFLSRAGVASRREAERLMAEGRVRVNGKPVTTFGSRVVPGTDRVELDGRRVELRPYRWIMLNKPRGTITTRSDPRGRRIVYSHLAPVDRELRYVGRLDRNTEGLLLFTNEGDLHHALAHPSSEMSREYRLTVEGSPTRAVLRMLEEGVELEDGVARAESVRVLQAPHAAGEGAALSLVLREGRNREVRRLLETVGHPILRLRRVGFGPIRLSGVRSGRWRELGEDEIRALRRAAGKNVSGGARRRRANEHRPWPDDGSRPRGRGGS